MLPKSLKQYRTSEQRLGLLLYVEPKLLHCKGVAIIILQVNENKIKNSPHLNKELHGETEKVQSLHPLSVFVISFQSIGDPWSI